jgi:hypothetical protein
MGFNRRPAHLDLTNPLHLFAVPRALQVCLHPPEPRQRSLAAKFAQQASEPPARGAELLMDAPGRWRRT